MATHTIVSNINMGLTQDGTQVAWYMDTVTQDNGALGMGPWTLTVGSTQTTTEFTDAAATILTSLTDSVNGLVSALLGIALGSNTTLLNNFVKG